MENSNVHKKNWSRFLKKRHTSYNEKKYSISGSTPKPYVDMKNSSVRPFCFKCNKVKLTEDHACN